MLCRIRPWLANRAASPGDERAVRWPRPRRRRQAALLLLTLAIAGTAAGARLAEQSPGSRPLISLAEAQAVAGVNSALVRMVEAQLDQAILEENEAQLTADGIAEDQVTSYEVATYKYLQPQRRTVERELAAAKLEGTSHNLDLQIALVYLGTLQAERFLDLALEGWARARDQLELTRKMQTAGLVAHKDVLDATAREAEARSSLAAARKAVALTELSLLRLLGDGRTDTPRLDPSTLGKLEDGFGVEAWVMQALERRFEIRQINGYHAIAELNLDLARRYPSGGLPVSEIPDIPGLPELPPGFFEPSWERSYRYTIPLAEARLREVSAARELQFADIEYQVRSVHLDVIEARERAMLMAAAVDAAAEGYRLARLRYEAGVAVNLEVLGAELALRQAETERARATYQYQSALAQLIQAASPGYRSAGAGGF